MKLPSRLLSMACCTMASTSVCRCAFSAEIRKWRCRYITVSGCSSGAANFSRSTCFALLALIPPMLTPPAETPLAISLFWVASYAQAPTATARSTPTTTATSTSERCFMGGRYPETSGLARTEYWPKGWSKFNLRQKCNPFCGETCALLGARAHSPSCQDGLDRGHHRLAVAGFAFVLEQRLEVGRLERAEQRDDLLGLQVVVVLH